MVKKVVFEVEDYTKVLNFVSEQKVSSPGVTEVFKILNEAILMDIQVVEEIPPQEKKITAEDFEQILAGE
jgi:hypothetical protein